MTRSDPILAVWGRVPVRAEFLGRVPYSEIVDMGRTRRDAYQAGEAAEAFWLCEHDWVLTTGRRPVPDLPPPAFWAERGIARVQTERGGLATLHGPGQLVAMLVLDLSRRGLGVRRAVEAIQAGLVRWLARYGIEAGLRSGAPGVWVGRDKIASIGLHIRRGVCLHGFALNLDIDLEPFGWFTPCGVSDAGTTSVRVQTGRSMTPSECASEVADDVLWSLLHSAVDRLDEGQ